MDCTVSSGHELPNGVFLWLFPGAGRTGAGALLVPSLGLACLLEAGDPG